MEKLNPSWKVLVGVLWCNAQHINGRPPAEIQQNEHFGERVIEPSLGDSIGLKDCDLSGMYEQWHMYRPASKLIKLIGQKERYFMVTNALCSKVGDKISHTSISTAQFIYPHVYLVRKQPSYRIRFL